jgi:beta-lactamase regulating signal transducer with metallopeptidase domain
VPSWAAGGEGAPALGATGWETVFRHELAHLKRGDPWAGLLAEVLVALLWWQPLAWLLRRRLLLAAEFACDDWAQFEAADAADYAEALLALVPVCPAAPLPGAQAAAGELLTRLQRLLGRDRIAPPALRRGGWVAAPLVALVLSGAAALVQAPPARAGRTVADRAGLPSLVERFGR